MTFTLSDDGTLDTGLICDECDETLRYNHDGCSHFDNFESGCTCYRDFIKWAIADATDTHACNDDDQADLDLAQAKAAGYNNDIDEKTGR